MIDGRGGSLDGTEPGAAQGEREGIAPVIRLAARRGRAAAASADGAPSRRAEPDAASASPGFDVASTEADTDPDFDSNSAPHARLDSGEVAFLPGVREADERRAENVSMHGLARRGMSRSEVLDLLKRREIDPIVAEAEIARLEGSGLIDDEALARTLVERLTERKKLGPSALRAELQRRRLSAATIEIALAEREVDDEGALLDGLVDDRLRRMGSLDRETAERRLLAFLARKGHGGGAARDSVRRALDEAGLESAPRTGFGQRGAGGGFGQRGSGSGGFGRSGGAGGFGRRPSAASSRRDDGAAGGPRAVEFE